LLLAVLGNHAEAVEVLLEGGADSTIYSGPLHRSALYQASALGYNAVVRSILSSSVASIDMSDNFDRAATRAERRLISDELLGAAELLGSQDTALHVAVENNRLEVVKTLLEFGARHDIKSDGGFTPLVLAARDGHEEILTLLLEQPGIAVNVQTAQMATPVLIACRRGKLRCVELLLNAGSDVTLRCLDGTNCLHQALFQEHFNIDIFKRMLAAGVSLSDKFNGLTPIELAIANKKRDAVREIRVHIDANARPCRNSQSGSGCPRGRACLFSHSSPATPPPPPPCVFFAQGRCRYGDECRFSHTA